MCGDYCLRIFVDRGSGPQRVSELLVENVLQRRALHVVVSL